jgi:hypothetical protein
MATHRPKRAKKEPPTTPNRMPDTNKLIRVTDRDNRTFLINPQYVSHTLEGGADNYIYMNANENQYAYVTKEELTNFTRQWRAFLEGIQIQ